VSASFEDSCRRFREFLARNGYPLELVWITSDDVLLTGRNFLYVKLPSPDRGGGAARARFEAATKAQSGVSFKGLFETDHKTLCTVWVASDDSECERAMCSKTDLKMSAPVERNRPPIKEVRSRFVWWCLRLRYREKQTGKDDLFWG